MNRLGLYGVSSVYVSGLELVVARWRSRYVLGDRLLGQ